MCYSSVVFPSRPVLLPAGEGFSPKRWGWVVGEQQPKDFAIQVASEEGIKTYVREDLAVRGDIEPAWYPITPVPKPRMTQSDRWKTRPGVKRFFAFRDQVKKTIPIPDGPFAMVFGIPMPASWSNKKKALFRCTPHQSKPDKDNLEKALLDSLYGDDSGIWCTASAKIWLDTGAIGILLIDHFNLVLASEVRPVPLIPTKKP